MDLITLFKNIFKYNKKMNILLNFRITIQIVTMLKNRHKK